MKHSYYKHLEELEMKKLLEMEHEIYQEEGQYITKDDILNLRILLETTKTVDEFILKMTKIKEKSIY